MELTIGQTNFKLPLFLQDPNSNGAGLKNIANLTLSTYIVSGPSGVLASGSCVAAVHGTYTDHGIAAAATTSAPGAAQFGIPNGYALAENSPLQVIINPSSNNEFVAVEWVLPIVGQSGTNSTLDANVVSVGGGTVNAATDGTVPVNFTAPLSDGSVLARILPVYTVTGVTNPTSANGTYRLGGLYNDHPYYTNGAGWYLFWTAYSGGAWWFSQDFFVLSPVSNFNWQGTVTGDISPVAAGPYEIGGSGTGWTGAPVPVAQLTPMGVYQFSVRANDSSGNTLPTAAQVAALRGQSASNPAYSASTTGAALATAAQVSALPSAATVADAVSATLSAVHGSGAWGASGGNGIHTITLTVQNTGSTNVAGATIALAKPGTYVELVTDINGQAVFHLDTGTFQQVVVCPAYQILTASLAISSDSAYTATLTPLSQAVPGPGQCACYLQTTDGAGAAQGGVLLSFQEIAAPDGTAGSAVVLSTTSDNSGNFVILLARGARYHAWRGSSQHAGKPVLVEVPQEDTFTLPAVLGAASGD